MNGAPGSSGGASLPPNNQGRYEPWGSNPWANPMAYYNGPRVPWAPVPYGQYNLLPGFQFNNAQTYKLPIVPMIQRPVTPTTPPPIAPPPILPPEVILDTAPGGTNEPDDYSSWE